MQKKVSKANDSAGESLESNDRLDSLPRWVLIVSTGLSREA